MSLAPRIYVIFLVILLVFSFLIRLLGWDDPYFGFHIDRKLGTLQTITFYARDGVDFLRPYKYWMQLGWQEYLLLELPIYQALSAWTSTFTETVLSASRGVNLFFALLTLLVVFQIAAIQFCRKTATYAALFFAFAPLNLMYHSATLPDISAVFFVSLAYWALAEYLKGTQNKTIFVIFLLAGGYSVLVKPLYFLPVGVLLVTHFLQQWGRPRMKNLLNYVVRYRAVICLFVLITSVMFLWIEVQKEVNQDSINSLQFLTFSHLYDVFFYMRMLFRWFLLILNPFTFLFFILGVLLLFRDYRGSEQLALFYSIVAYHIIFGRIFTGHEYYLLVMVPFASVIAGRGAYWIEERIQSDFRIRSRHALSTAIILGSAICSVLIFSVNSIAALDLEQRTLPIEKEMHGVLEQEKYVFVYVDKTNFPTHDYVVYDRTSKLKYFAGLLSKEQIRLRSLPVRPLELLGRLKTYGDVEWTLSGTAPEVDVEKIQTRYQGHLRYLMFYRFTEEDKTQIKNRIEGYKLIYESVNWLVYDLASG
ncbi:MAG TPA: hypothetical protein DCM60_08050 [Nitrospina sp.]|nr:hypothetical protein [Nitrospina sp.]